MFLYILPSLLLFIFFEALSFMCDVIKIRLERRIAMRSGKGNKLLDVKTVVERQILKLGLPNFMWSFCFILLLVASLLFNVYFYDVTHATFQRFINSLNWYFHIKYKLLPILIWTHSKALTTSMNPWFPGASGMPR